MAKPVFKLFGPSGRPIVFSDPCTNTQFQEEPCQRGRKINGVGKFLQFSTEITIYLGNGARQAHCYYGTLIRNHR